jgi:chromate transporter
VSLFSRLLAVAGISIVAGGTTEGLGEEGGNMSIATETEHRSSRIGSPLEVLRIFLKLGLTYFGGPIAHTGYFRDEFVVRPKWIDEHAYADLVGLCQFLSGPASS